jgi:hypothetical protein
VTGLLQACVGLRGRLSAVTPARPASIMAQVPASGTAVTVAVTKPLLLNESLSR